MEMTTDLHIHGDLAQVSTDDLRKELGRSLELTAHHLYHMAKIWRELESRGEDLSNLRHGLAAYLPLIANGRLDADVLVRYAGQKTLLTALSNLPLPEQRRIAESGYVVVARLNAEGKRTDVETPLEKLAAADIYHVFGEFGLRAPDEQHLLMMRRLAKSSTVSKPPRRARRVRVDAANHVLLVSNTAADMDRVLQALSDHYGVNLPDLIHAARAASVP